MMYRKLAIVVLPVVTFFAGIQVGRMRPDPRSPHAGVPDAHPGKGQASRQGLSGGHPSRPELKPESLATRTPEASRKNLQAELDQILTLEPSDERSARLNELAGRAPLDLALFSDSIFRVGDLTTQERQGIVMFLSMRIRMLKEPGEMMDVISRSPLMEESKFREQAALALATGTGFVEGRKLAATLPADSPVRREVESQLAEVAGTADPQSFIREVEKPGGDELLKTHGRDFIMSWSSNEPRAALEWVDKLPAATEAEKEVLMPSAFLGWTMNDSLQVSKWLASYPEGNLRDQMVLRMVTSLCITGDSGSAAQWIESIRDPAIKAKALEQPEIYKKR